MVNDADYTIIFRRDADDTVVMSLDYFNSLMETVHLLKSPANVVHLEKFINQYHKCKKVERGLVNDWGMGSAEYSVISRAESRFLMVLCTRRRLSFLYLTRF